MRPRQSSCGKAFQVPLCGSCSWRWRNIFLPFKFKKTPKHNKQKTPQNPPKKISGSLLLPTSPQKRHWGRTYDRSQEQQDDTLVGNTQVFQACPAQRKGSGAVFATPWLVGGGLHTRKPIKLLCYLKNQNQNGISKHIKIKKTNISALFEEKAHCRAIK